MGERKAYQSRVSLLKKAFGKVMVFASRYSVKLNEENLSVSFFVFKTELVSCTMIIPLIHWACSVLFP